MAEEKNDQQAKEIFEMLCWTMDEHGWKYQKHEEKLTIQSGTKTEDLPIQFFVRVDAQRMLVSLVSVLPFRIKKEKRLDAAVAVSVINNTLADGSFRYDVSTGNLMFVMTNNFRENSMSQDAFTYMIYCSCKIIDEFNEKLFLLVTGSMTMEQFLNAVTNG